MVHRLLKPRRQSRRFPASLPAKHGRSMGNMWERVGTCGNVWEHGSARDLHSSTCWSLQTFSFCSTVSLFVKSSNYWAGDNDKPTFACAFCWQSVRAAAELKQTHYPSILWKFVQQLRKLPQHHFLGNNIWTSVNQWF